jgi:hypothetical protein
MALSRTSFVVKTILFAFVLSCLLTVAFILSINFSEADNEQPDLVLNIKEESIWGVNFSESQATYLELNPNEVYQQIIHDLGAKRIKIHVNWNATEPINNVYDFTSLDNYIKKAEENKVKLILVIGKKTGRWPECHTPSWFEGVAEEDRQAEIISYASEIVNRYKDSPAVEYWQVENEPFLEFGTCSDWYYDQETSLVEALVSTVRSIDTERKIIISESGELSNWTKAAELADIVGVTMYRSTWNIAEKTFGINPYSFLEPAFYANKADFIRENYGKPVISIELQAEPWTSEALMDSSLEEQALSMNAELFKENVEFAKQTDLEAYYFWGVEWWYWMKTKHNQPEIWNLAKDLLNS